METLTTIKDWGLSPEAIAIIIAVTIITRAFIHVIRIIVESHNQSNNKFTKAIDRMTEVIDRKWSD